MEIVSIVKKITLKKIVVDNRKTFFVFVDGVVFDNFTTFSSALTFVDGLRTAFELCGIDVVEVDDLDNTPNV